MSNQPNKNNLWDKVGTILIIIGLVWVIYMVFFSEYGMNLDDDGNERRNNQSNEYYYEWPTRMDGPP